jgi:hypothetical protein
MRTNAKQTCDPSFHRGRLDQIVVVQKKEGEEEDEEGERKTRKRRIASESADAMRKRSTKANTNEEKTNKRGTQKT